MKRSSTATRARPASSAAITSASGYAWRMSELHAALGVVQLGRLDEFIAVRRRVASLYDKGLVEIPGVQPLAVDSECEPNYYKYIAYLDEGIDRQQVKDALRRRGVSPSGEVYASPLHLQPVFADLPAGDLRIAEDVCRRHLCLPIHLDMTDDEAGRVVDRARCRDAGGDEHLGPRGGSRLRRPSTRVLDPVHVVVRPAHNRRGPRVVGWSAARRRLHRQLVEEPMLVRAVARSKVGKTITKSTPRLRQETR